MRRSLALIAVGAAVAVAAVVVVAGMTSGDDGAAAGTATETLPSGHPSVAAESKPAEDPAPDAGVEDTIARLEGQRAEDPADMDVLVKLGEAYFMGQRLQLARQAYDEVIQQDPDNAAAQVGLAMVLHAKGESGRAEKSLRAVLDAHPDNQAAHYSLAIIHFSAGRVGEAKSEWQTAARLDPNSTTGRRSQSFVDLLEGQDSETHAGDE